MRSLFLRSSISMCSCLSPTRPKYMAESNLCWRLQEASYLRAVTARYTGWQPSFLRMGLVEAGLEALAPSLPLKDLQSAQLDFRLRSASQLSINELMYPD